MSNKFCLPDHITPEIFLKEYWQKKPLLIRNGLPQIVGQFEPADILELAQGEDVTARLLKQYSEDNWKLKLSPLSEADFAELPEQWTVLVQNMEQWSSELGELWNQFGFIPQWQRDDIMVSYAPKGGSVGKHYDEYDVFLVQGYGHRRWQLGKWCNPSTEFKPNQPIRIFDDMGELVLDEVMAPGDILYIPSRLSHYGVAQDDCLTFSFGLRYPNLTDLLENVQKGFCHQNPDIDLTAFNIPLRLTPDLQQAGELAPQAVAEMKRQFLEKLASDEQFDRLFQQAVATAVSARRYELFPTEEMSDPEEVRSILAEENGILRQDNNCKLVYSQNPLQIYANGEWLDELNPLERSLLKRLADGECIDFADLSALVETTQDKDTALDLLLDSICNWLDDGWVLLD
ncbi:cupin domain-containing protein [Caviibacterium pharyngocola]|uniref:Ribosomal oxygenase n=1 Tax=Caviibacterium pharyngocola TaxID=28159 RepID=A0A2M8RTN9_9PAST|nr:cupin domain-containing protein [Caviibacterium pharyngocola]PJG82256.1 ribosomal oxygenase [Caviibacterium pharyngocola]